MRRKSFKSRNPAQATLASAMAFIMGALMKEEKKKIKNLKRYFCGESKSKEREKTECPIFWILK